MKKLVLSAAVLVASVFAAPSYACNNNGYDAECQVDLEAYVKEACWCEFKGSELDFGELKHNVPESLPTELYIHCNTKYTKVKVSSEEGGLVGDSGGEKILWDLIHKGNKIYTSNLPEHTFKYVPTYKSPFALEIKTKPFNFYKVIPEDKEDALIVKVSPVSL